jgi:hypothetical protein
MDKIKQITASPFVMKFAIGIIAAMITILIVGLILDFAM